MSFSDAFGYPFRSENIPKILTIILVFLIIVAAILVSAMLFEAENLIWAAIPIVLSYFLFLYGYIVAVIKNIVDGQTALPQPQLGRDLGRGFVVLLAAIIHAIPIFVLYFCGAAIFGAALGATFAATGSSGGGAGSGIVLVCGLAIVLFGCSSSLVILSLWR